MTSQGGFLQLLIGELSRHGIAYMVSGSVCSSLHGEPRATRDVDIVIVGAEDKVLDFVQSLGRDYYVSLDAVRDALARRTMFNVIDSRSGYKADFVIRKDRRFSREEFGRRRTTKIAGLDVWVTSPEDTILTKLEWGKDSQSEQQFRDALGVAVVQWDHLDRDYLRKWAKELQVESSLEQLLRVAERRLDSK